MLLLRLLLLLRLPLLLRLLGLRLGEPTVGFAAGDGVAEPHFGGLLDRGVETGPFTP